MSVELVSRRWRLIAQIRCDEGSAAPEEAAGSDSRETRTAMLWSEDRDNDPEAGDVELVGGATISTIPDERRPGRRGLLIEDGGAAIGVCLPAQQTDPPTGSLRCVILDASWTHVQSFPDREEVRDYWMDALGRRNRAIHYVTNLPWDATAFDRLALETGHADRARSVLIPGNGARLAARVRTLIPSIRPDEAVLLGLVPARDDRGLFQRLRSEFAERTEHVLAYPTVPLSSGPGQSREETGQVVGAWLPTTVLIAGGPVSEQVLLARYLRENAAASSCVVATAGSEYRLPSLDVVRQPEAKPREPRRAPLKAAAAGLVIVSYGPDGNLRFAGGGLAEQASAILPKVRVGSRAKTPEQIVHDVESAFSSRGLPLPVVRFLP